MHKKKEYEMTRFTACSRICFVVLFMLLIGCEDASDIIQDDNEFLDDDLSLEDAPWLYHGSWTGEWIEEKAPYSGRSRYYSTGYYYDNGSICGYDNGPNDTVFMFTVPAGVNTSKLRVYSDSSRARCAIPDGLSTRVHSDGHVEACVDYWHMYFCWVNPSTFRSTTYLWIE